MDDLIRRLDSAAGGDVGEYWSDLFAEAKDEIIRLRVEAEEYKGIMTDLIKDTIATLRAAANQIDRLTRNSERT